MLRVISDVRSAEFGEWIAMRRNPACTIGERLAWKTANKSKVAAGATSSCAVSRWSIRRAGIGGTESDQIARADGAGCPIRPGVPSTE